MDTLLVIDCGRGVYKVYYNGLTSRPVPAGKVEAYKHRAMRVYHARWGRGI